MLQLNSADPDLIVVSGEYQELGEKIKKITGTEVFYTKQNLSLDLPVMFHPDMQFLCFEDIAYILPGCEYLEPMFSRLGKSVIYTDMAEKSYPNDVKCNAKIVGNNLICKKSAVDKSVLDYCSHNGYNIIDVKQGYSACSICVVDKHTILTSDANIHKEASKFGIRSFLCDSSKILLKGYDCGFIGGSSGFIGNNKLAFTGCIKEVVPDEAVNYINSIGLEILELGDKLIDIGGIVPVYKND